MESEGAVKAVRRRNVALVGDAGEGYHILLRVANGRVARLWYGDYTKAYKAFVGYAAKELPEEVRGFARPPEEMKVLVCSEGVAEERTAWQLELW